MKNPVKIRNCFYSKYTKSLIYKIFLKKKISKNLRYNEKIFFSLKKNLSSLGRFFIYTGQLINNLRLNLKRVNIVKLLSSSMLLVYNLGNGFQKKLKSHEKIYKTLNVIDLCFIGCANNFKNIEFYITTQIKIWVWALRCNFIQNSFLFFQKNKLLEYSEKFNFKIKHLSSKSKKNTNSLCIFDFTEPIFTKSQNNLNSSQNRAFYTSNKLIFNLNSTFNKNESGFIQFSVFTIFSGINPWVIINETLEFFFYQALKRLFKAKNSEFIEKLRFNITFFKIFLLYRKSFPLKAKEFEKFSFGKFKITLKRENLDLFLGKTLTDFKIQIFFNKKPHSRENYIVPSVPGSKKHGVKDFDQDIYFLRIRKFYVNINWINEKFLNTFLKNINNEYDILKAKHKKNFNIFVESLLFSSLIRNNLLSKWFAYIQKKNLTLPQSSFVESNSILFGVQNFYEIQILF
jgi:hypothetical protein